MGKVWFLLLALFWPLQAVADAPDHLRGLIRSGNVLAVEAMLREARASDLVAKDEPWRQRKRFLVFRETAPEVEAFLTQWQSQKPDSAFAITAQGWHLFATAWTARGEGASRDVYPEAMQVFSGNLTKARNLAWAALAADPDLIAASDLVLVTASKLDHGAGLLAELDRVMRLHPNRGSLLNATDGLAPQWGWWPWVSQALCATYAPMIKTVAGYDSATCGIDVVYSAGYSLGPAMQKAHDDLQTNRNPVLDYARVQEATFFQIPDQQRITILQATKAKRRLSFAEARQLDLARAAVAGTDQTYDERKIAIAAEVPLWQAGADRDPYNAKTVMGYIAMRSTAVWLLNSPPDTADWTRRLQRLVSRMPYSAEAWKSLGQMTTQDLWSGKTDPAPGGGWVDVIAAAEPYFSNEILYSNYAYSSLYDAMQAKVWALTDRVSLIYPLDPFSGTAQQNKRLKEVVYCPLVRQVRITKYLCEQWAGTTRQCTNSPLVLPEVEAALKAVTDHGACRTEATAPMDDLWYRPVAMEVAE